MMAEAVGPSTTITKNGGVCQECQMECYQTVSSISVCSIRVFCTVNRFDGSLPKLYGYNEL